eukprot:2688021-Alexandrium_andersonii.AAC.1
MSASLVGSEMCIRDRHMGNSASSSFQQFPVVSCSFLCLLPGMPPPGPPPVSYTHLTLPTICSV